MSVGWFEECGEVDVDEGRDVTFECLTSNHK
jgi:hypothetical protein